MKKDAFAAVLIANLAFAANATAQLVVCHAEGTPAETVAAQILAAASAGPQTANVSGGWTRTATDGSGLVRGEPITLTWSVVPDGTAITGTLTGESNAASNLVAYLNSNFGSIGVWRNVIQLALDGWSNGPGVTFVYEPMDDRVAIRSTSTARGALGVRADIRIGGHDIDGDANVVAYAYLPNGGDIVIDTADFFNSTTARLRNVIAHESGHAMGLGHVCPINETKLMEPSISTRFSGPQFDDLLGAHRTYGDVNEDNDVFADASDEGFAVGVTTNVNDLALDGSSDDDWFLLPSGTLTELTVHLDPAGASYPLGSTGSGSCAGVATPVFDPTMVQDLRIDIIDFDGQTTVATSHSTGAGGSESVSDVRMSKFGGYVRVVGAGDDDTQAYELEVTLVPEPDRSLLIGAALVAVASLKRRRR